MAKKKTPKEDLLKSDFRNFLYACFQYLGFGDPTPVQYEIAYWLQHGPDRTITEAFRGVGKSIITACFVLWILYRDKDKKVLIVSASKERAAMFTTFLLQLIFQVPFLKHLYPDPDQRQSTISFDVAGCQPDQTPSVRAIGITGTMVGSRADVIVPDDVESPKNSSTEAQRIKLAEAVKEFDAILKPGGAVRYLGTPQTQFSLYNTLQERGYVCRIWPAEYPDADRMSYYGERLAPNIREAVINDPPIVGQTTEPSRFPNEELEKRQASYGRSGYAMQFMLDTRLSDLYRFPLKLADLIVMDVDRQRGPEHPVWCSAPEKAYSDLPNVGFGGDRFYAPLAIEGNWQPYDGVAMHIDPAGRGKDETAYTVTAALNGYVYLLAGGGLMGGPTDENLTRLAVIAKDYEVNHVEIEANFGDGMFTKLISTVFRNIYPVTIEEVKHSTRKELRIIDTLEPVLGQHRLVVNAKFIRSEWDELLKRDGDDSIYYSLTHQMTRITRDPGCLNHDDRLDALAMAVAYWQEHFQKDVKKAIEARKEKERLKMLTDFMRSAGKVGKMVGPRWAKRR